MALRGGVVYDDGPAQPVTSPACGAKEITGLPVPERKLPVGEVLDIQPTCWPVVVSQIRAVPSSLAVANWVPPGW